MTVSSQQVNTAKKFFCPTQLEISSIWSKKYALVFGKLTVSMAKDQCTSNSSVLSKNKKGKLLYDVLNIFINRQACKIVFFIAAKFLSVQLMVKRHSGQGHFSKMLLLYTYIHKEKITSVQRPFELNIHV